MDPMTFELARNTVKWYACSGCWGDLESNPDPQHDGTGHAGQGAYLVTCKNCRDETQGYVSKSYVERRRGESEFEAREAKRVLVKAGVLPNPLAGKSKQDLLKDLGFGG